MAVIDEVCLIAIGPIGSAHKACHGIVLKAPQPKKLTPFFTSFVSCLQKSIPEEWTSAALGAISSPTNGMVRRQQRKTDVLALVIMALRDITGTRKM